MKRLFAALVFINSLHCFAQAYPDLTDNHEIKFNIGLLLASTVADFSYEYYLNEDTSLGGSLYFASDELDYQGDFGIGPNFRAYFGQAPRSGFFAEAFGLYYTGEEEVNDPVLGNISKDYNSLALGLGLGKKLVTRSQKFTLELMGGFGRNLNPQDFQNDLVYRVGLSIGFRF